MKTELNQKTRDACVDLLMQRLSYFYLFLLFLMLLMPFRFTFDPVLFGRNISGVFFPWHAESVFDPGVIADVLQNIVLFLPFGFLFKSAKRSSMFKVTAVAFCFSFSAEFLQAWTEERVASFFDLAMNTSGAFLGALPANPMQSKTRSLAWRLLSFSPSRRASLIPALTSYIAVFFIIFFPLVPAKGIRWNPDYDFYLGGLPHASSVWQGTIQNIKFKSNRVLHRPASGQTTEAPVFDLDFTAPDAVSRYIAGEALPQNVSWSGEGLSLSGSYVKLKPALTRTLAERIGTGAPFFLEVVFTPATIGFEQKGSIFSYGADTWHYDLSLDQHGTNLEFFVRTTLSGASWREPKYRMYDILQESRDIQTVDIAFDDKSIRSWTPGGALQDILFLNSFRSLSGQLFISPILVETLTFYLLLLFIPAFFSRYYYKERQNGDLYYAAVSCGILFPLVVFLFQMISVLNYDLKLLCAVPLSSAAAVYLCHAWTCASGSRDAKVIDSP